MPFASCEWQGMTAELVPVCGTKFLRVSFAFQGCCCCVSTVVLKELLFLSLKLYEN